jgi:hypothetical protein
LIKWLILHLRRTHRPIKEPERVVRDVDLVEEEEVDEAVEEAEEAEEEIVEVAIALAEESRGEKKTRSQPGFLLPSLVAL